MHAITLQAAERCMILGEACKAPALTLRRRHGRSVAGSIIRRRTDRRAQRQSRGATPLIPMHARRRSPLLLSSCLPCPAWYMHRPRRPPIACMAMAMAGRRLLSLSLGSSSNSNSNACLLSHLNPSKALALICISMCMHSPSPDSRERGQPGGVCSFGRGGACHAPCSTYCKRERGKERRRGMGGRDEGHFQLSRSRPPSPSLSFIWAPSECRSQKLHPSRSCPHA